ncbi:MAG: hypothetical protein H8D23_07070 [Candidatus Brocadiales bacterium]|nr:hypothetical protein [Candidatus Brocadiales bacterium]
MSMIDGLPREVIRDYYKKHLLVNLSPKETNAFFEGKTQKEVIKDLVDMGIDITCLMFQTGLRGYLDSPNGNCNGKKYSRSYVVNLTMRYANITPAHLTKAIRLLEKSYHDSSTKLAHPNKDVVSLSA